jgi:hypothetical protein
MAGTFPTSPAPSSIKVSSHQPTLVSMSHSMKRQVRTRGSQRWSFELQFPPMTRAEFAPIFAHVVKQQGQFGTFTFVPHTLSDSLGSVSGSVTANGAAAVGDSTVAISGLTGTLKAGDFVKFAGHDKAYMLTADATTSLSIEPALMSAVANGEAVTYSSVPFVCALASDVHEFETGAPAVYAFQVALIEVA